MKKRSVKKKILLGFPEVSEVLKAMAHPDRIAIIDLLCNGGYERMTVKTIYERLKMEQPVASKHLGIMKRSGIMKRETEKNYAYFRLNMENDIVICLSSYLKK